MLSSKIDVLLRHPVADRFHVVCGFCHTDLKVAVAAIASELVVTPLGGWKAERRQGLRVSWQPGVVWLEELLKPLITGFALQSADGGCNAS